MRFAWVLALALAGLTMTATAQKHQRPKPKASYSEDKHGGKSSARAVKEPASHTSAAQELRRVEQSSARGSSSRKAKTGKAARSNPALKEQKNNKENPPIHFASAGGSGKGNKSKVGDPYKGRLKQKGKGH